MATPIKNKKTIQAFGFASFLNDLGAEMISPIWPIFVTTVLGANMEVLGFIDGLGIAIVSISKAISGYVSDRIKRRKVFIWLGYLFGGLSRIGYALSQTWAWLIPFKILDRMGKLRDSPRDAMVADLSDHDHRGRNFGGLRMMDNLGAAFGIFISILAIKTLGYSKLFLLAALPSLVAVVVVWVLVKEKKPVEQKISDGIRLKAVSGQFKWLLALGSIFALGSFSYSFLLIFANRIGFEPTSLPLLYFLFTATASIVSIPFGRLVDHWGRKAVLMLSYLFWVGVCVSFMFLKTEISIIFAFLLYGLHKGAIEPAQRTLVSELAPKEFRASCLGTFDMAIGLCALPASLIAGILWDKVGDTAPFYFSLGATVLSMVMMLFLKERSKDVG